MRDKCTGTTRMLIAALALVAIAGCKPNGSPNTPTAEEGDGAFRTSRAADRASKRTRESSAIACGDALLSLSSCSDSWSGCFTILFRSESGCGREWSGRNLRSPRVNHCSDPGVVSCISPLATACDRCGEGDLQAWLWSDKAGG